MRCTAHMTRCDCSQRVAIGFEHAGYRSTKYNRRPFHTSCAL